MSRYPLVDEANDAAVAPDLEIELSKPASDQWRDCLGVTATEVMGEGRSPGRITPFEICLSGQRCGPAIRSTEHTLGH
jgi:hypothetical protein